MPNGTPKQLANLKPKDLSKRSNHKEISSRGGKAKTPAKSIAALIRESKKKGLSAIQAEYLALVESGQIDGVANLQSLFSRLLTVPL